MCVELRPMIPACFCVMRTCSRLRSKLCEVKTETCELDYAPELVAIYHYASMFFMHCAHTGYKLCATRLAGRLRAALLVLRCFKCVRLFAFQRGLLHSLMLHFLHKTVIALLLKFHCRCCTWVQSYPKHDARAEPDRAGPSRTASDRARQS